MACLVFCYDEYYVGRFCSEWLMYLGNDIGSWGKGDGIRLSC